MNFEEGHLYHVFNRGNNSQRIFFKRDNYLFFLEKIRKYVLPHSDIIAWCLMPNHFHFLLLVNKVSVATVATDLMTQSHQISSNSKDRTLNNSIAIVLRSYTRAIHKQQKMHGSLFQSRTKAFCLTQQNGLSPAWFRTRSGAMMNTSKPDLEYPQICFNYIHKNPVSAGLVNKQEDWTFSSAKDYAGIRNCSITNKVRTAEFGLNYYSFDDLKSSYSI